MSFNRFFQKEIYVYTLSSSYNLPMVYLSPLNILLIVMFIYVLV
nr:MAG TPA: protein of unknown function (DUF5383) [Crassvirales sp.]